MDRTLSQTYGRHAAIGVTIDESGIVPLRVMPAHLVDSLTDSGRTTLDRNIRTVDGRIALCKARVLVGK